MKKTIIAMLFIFAILPTALAQNNTEVRQSVLNQCQEFPCTIRELPELIELKETREKYANYRECYMGVAHQQLALIDTLDFYAVREFGDWKTRYERQDAVLRWGARQIVRDFVVAEKNKCATAFGRRNI